MSMVEKVRNKLDSLSEGIDSLICMADEALDWAEERGIESRVSEFIDRSSEWGDRLVRLVSGGSNDGEPSRETRSAPDNTWRSEGFNAPGW